MDSVPILSVFLSIAAVLCHTVAYLEYNRGFLFGDTKPNGATWAIWSTIAAISTGTYLKNSGDMWMSLLPLINILLCVGTFMVALWKRRFERLDSIEWAALGIGLCAAFVWWLYQSAVYANLIAQVAVLVGFIAMWRTVWKNPLTEEPRPWWIWVAGYCLMVLVVVLRWQGQWIDLVYPVIAALLHAGTLFVRSYRTQGISSAEVPA